MGIKPWLYWNVFEEIDKQVEDIGVVSFVNAFRRASRMAYTIAKVGFEKSNMFTTYWNLGFLVSYRYFLMYLQFFWKYLF